MGGQNRCQVWLNGLLPNARVFAGDAENTRASPGAWWKRPSRTSYRDCPSHLAAHAAAGRSSVASSVTGTASLSHNDVEPVLPGVAPGHDDHVRVVPQADRLLLAGSAAKVDRSVEPHRDRWRDVRAAVGPDRADPAQRRP